MPDNSIAVKISADASGFRAGAQEAEQHTNHLRESLIELKGEHVQSARVARFYANEIAELVPGADAARESIQALVRVALAGGGFGVAVAAVGFLVAAFKNLSEAIDQSKEQFKKLEEDAKEYSAKTKQHVEDVIAAIEGETRAMNEARTKALPLLQDETKLVGQLAAARTALQTATEEEVLDEQGLVRQMFAQAAATKDIIRLEAELAKVQSQQRDARAGVGTIAGKEGSKADRDAADAAAVARRKSIEEEINDVLRKHAEVQAYINSLDQSAIDLEKAKVKNILADAAEEQDAIKKANDEEAADAAAQIAGEMQLRKEAADEAEALAEAEAKKLATELSRAALQIGEAFGEVFKGVLQGTKSIEDSLQDLLVKMVEIALRMAALRELASGDFIGGAILGAGSVIAGAFGSGGGGSTNLTVNNHFAGTPSSSEMSLTMERAIVDGVRRAQSRGRLT